MPRDIYLESRVLTADPVELIHILYEQMLFQVKLARAAMAGNDIAGRCRATSKVLAILGELEGSLDHKAGGAISHNLAKLYQYMRRRLLDVSLKLDSAALGEVEALITTLDEGWTAMRQAALAPPAPSYYTPAAESAERCWSA